MIKSILFHRDYKNFTGGHLKVWDYFNHFLRLPNCRPEIYFTPNSRSTHGNPWASIFENRLPAYKPNDANLLFLAGTDWRAIKGFDLGTKPVINLIQHVQHADPNGELYTYLSNAALRICVSDAVEKAILNTGIVNGPTVTIENGIDLEQFHRISGQINKKYKFCVVGIKNPELANALGQAIGSNGNIILTRGINRAEYLRTIASSECAIFIPNPTEGFYLPALEAMALKTAVICPDVIGNRSFCVDAETAFIPKALNFDSYNDQIKKYRQAPEYKKCYLIDCAYKKSIQFSLDAEFLKLKRTLSEYLPGII